MQPRGESPPRYCTSRGRIYRQGISISGSAIRSQTTREAASEWLSDNDDADAIQLGEHISDFIIEHKDTILKEFGKAVIYDILGSWYTGDNDDVHELADSVDDSIDYDLNK